MKPPLSKEAQEAVEKHTQALNDAIQAGLTKYGYAFSDVNRAHITTYLIFNKDFKDNSGWDALVGKAIEKLRNKLV